MTSNSNSNSNSNVNRDNDDEKFQDTQFIGDGLMNKRKLPYFTMYDADTQAQDGLCILGAAFGLADVTNKVRGMVSGEELKCTANDATFGDGWVGPLKSLVIVYRYGSNAAVSQVANVEENTPMNITATSPWKKYETTDTTDNVLSILGAVYGLADVTDTAKAKISENSFIQTASDDVFGTNWKGHKKSLVVVYLFNQVTSPYVAVVAEGQVMEIIGCPILSILGASFGPKDVTSIVDAHNNKISVTLTANNDTFGPDPWVGNRKSLVVVYKYAGYEPSVKIVEGGSLFSVAFDPNKLKTDPNEFKPVQALSICGAAYGLEVATDLVNELIVNNDLNITVNSDTFNNGGWPNVDKTVTVVSRYGSGPCEVNIAKKNCQINIQQSNTNGGLLQYDACGLLEADDTFYLRTSFGSYWMLDETVDNAIGLSSEQNKAITFVVTVVNDDSHAFQLKDTISGRILVSGTGGQLVMAGSNSKTATKDNSYFKCTISADGYMRFYLDSTNSSVISVMNEETEHWSLYATTKTSTIIISELNKFDIVMLTTPATTAFVEAHNEILSGKRNFSVQDDVELCMKDPCITTWASFVWQLTGGFLGALGLIPAMNKAEQVAVGVFAKLRHNPKTSEYMDQLMGSASNSNNVKVFGSVSVSGFFAVMYEQGMIWKIIKMILHKSRFWGMAWALSKILKVVFLPEAEAEQMLAQFVVWQGQLIESILILIARQNAYPKNR